MAPRRRRTAEEARILKLPEAFRAPFVGGWYERTRPDEETSIIGRDDEDLEQQEPREQSNTRNEEVADAGTSTGVSEGESTQMEGVDHPVLVATRDEASQQDDVAAFGAAASNHADGTTEEARATNSTGTTAGTTLEETRDDSGEGPGADEEGSSKFNVVSEEEFESHYMGSYLRDTYEHMAASMKRALEIRGHAVTNVNIFWELLKPAIELLSDATTQQLVSSGLPPLAPHEMWEFIATVHLRSCFNLGVESTFLIIEELARKHGFVALEVKRYKQILQNLRGYDVQGRMPVSEDDIMWMQQDAMFRRLSPLEQRMFQNTVLFLRNVLVGLLVIDDELIASRASDVETKTVSSRKTGKEGPVSDCIACSMTSIMLGMRLRVVGESQQQNVESLMAGLNHPANSDAGRAPILCFDRGYGKMSFVELVSQLGYNCSTIAATQGSRHPFFSESEFNAVRQKWQAANVAPAEIKKREDLLKPWIIREHPHCGSEVFLAKKKLTSSAGGNKVLRAIAVREVFDRKIDSKILRFFNSGPTLGERHHHNVWVEVRKEGRLPPNTLFSHTGKHSAIWSQRVEVERRLLQTCIPLTVRQRTADWFTLRQFRLTGTTVSSILKDAPPYSDDPTPPPTPDELNKWMDACLQSWFGRHRSTTAMKNGSMNEEPTYLALSHQNEVVRDCFEVGLLQMKEHPYLGVSPDGIIVLNDTTTERARRFFAAHDNLAGDDDNSAEEPGNNPKYACVEIKTRSAQNTIAQAEAAVEKHGSQVYCQFGDEIFLECVPGSNRGQLLHQSIVTSFKYGLYVVSKVVEEEGSIVQLVVFHIPEELRRKELARLLRVASPLLGWLHSPDVRSRGHLASSDFPTWLKGTTSVPSNSPVEAQRKLRCDTLTSRARLFYAVNRCREGTQQANSDEQQQRQHRPNSQQRPESPPVVLPPSSQLYKHACAYLYNLGKGGVDMATLLFQKLRLGKTALAFESKYILRMILAVTVNAWRASQAIFQVAPYLSSHPNATTREIRNALRNSESKKSLQDYRFDLAIGLLIKLHREKGMHQQHSTSGDTETQDVNRRHPGQGRERMGTGELFEQHLSPRTRTRKQQEEKELLEQLDQLHTKEKFPVKGKRVLSFCNDKRPFKRLRTFRSRRLRHDQERIVTGGKEGRLPCALYASKEVQRKTVVQCSSCQVPLCTSTLEGTQKTTSDTCFYLWHMAPNLLTCHKKRCEDLKKIRETRAAQKAARDTGDDDSVGEEVADSEDTSDI